MIINKLDIPGMAIPELEGDPPRSAGRNRPLASTIATQAVQPHGFQAGQVIEPLGLVEQPQAPPRQGRILDRHADP